MKATVDLGPTLSVSAPVEVADLENLGIQYWTPLYDGRFLVGLKGDGGDDVKRYEMVLNWSEILKQ